MTTDTFPTALSEETICPDEVVAFDDDGVKTLLFYVGRHEAGYLWLKRVILKPEHAAGLVREPAGTDDGDVSELIIAREDDASCGACGSIVMPSGWCTNGHSPSTALVESLPSLPTGTT